MGQESSKLTEARKIFSAYLEKKGQRKTPERFCILDEIYSRNDHFDVDSLYVFMKNNNRNISRATVYNTLELLEECDLVSKNQFGSKLVLYEKCYGFRQHDHLICIECNKVTEFCDPRIYNIQKMIEELMGFKVHHHSLNLFGVCKECGAKK